MGNYDPFATDYDTWSAHMTEDVPWYVELARAAAEPIVELPRRSTADGSSMKTEWEITHSVPGDNRLDITRGSGANTLGVLQLWWVTKSEWEGLIDVAGLEVEALYGGFAREPFGDDSLEFVWVAQKPA
jgi:hypothetical protein